MKTAVRQILLSSEAINPSPNSLFSPIPQWIVSNCSVSADGIISEDATNTAHVLFRNAGTPPLLDNIPYRWIVWVRPLARRFVYLSIAPNAGASRLVTVWGLDGQGLLETKTVNNNPTNISTSYKRISSGIYKLTFNFTILSAGANQIPIVGLVDKFPPTYTAAFDVTFQGLNQPSIQILANELLPA